ncbi:hypothetical protein Bbelb_062870 [Branchiostoma belcheri]|nr:hypothetical protein Bbelb_062870 [Branchiostoma belcheri]
MGSCAVVLAISMSLVHLTSAFKACAYNGVCICTTGTEVDSNGTEVDCSNRDLPVVPDDILPTTAHNNPWSCDCHMKEILLTKVSSSITCQSPPHLKNFKLSSLNPDTLTCSSPTIKNCTQVHWAKVGETVTLCCTAIGFNRPTITWSHPLGPPSSIPTDKKTPHYQVRTTKLGYNHSKSTLTINNVEESDMGLYACLASNAAGFNLKSISFSVIPTTGTPTEILIGVAAGTSIGGLVLCTIVAFICYKHKHKQRPEREANSSSENSPQEETWPGTEFDEDESGYYDCVPSEGRPYQGLNVNLSQYQRPLPDIHVEN